jgi:hypothetical protein
MNRDEEGVQLLRGDDGDEASAPLQSPEARVEELVRERLAPEAMTAAQLAAFPVDRYSLRRERTVVGVIFGSHVVLLAGIAVATYWCTEAWRPWTAALVGLGLLFWFFNLLAWVRNWSDLADKALRGFGAFCGVLHFVAIVPFLVANREEPQIIWGEGWGDSYPYWRGAIAVLVLNAALFMHTFLFARSPWRPMGEGGCLTYDAINPPSDYDVMVSSGARKTYRVSYKDRVIFTGYLEEFEALPHGRGVNADQ